jgi:acetyl esterase/lipase
MFPSRLHGISVPRPLSSFGNMRACRLLSVLAATVLVCMYSTAAAQAPAANQASTAGAATDEALPHGEIQYLWPAGAPGAVGTEEQDKPHLEIFGGWGPGPHTAVVVCPGGGYTHLAYEKEGTRIAEWLNLRGITAFVLTYRLAPRYRYPAPVVDGDRAMRWVRSHAQQYGVAPDRIGIWGFSAGGHLVGMVGTEFDEGSPQSADPIERVSDRPDFAISSYGVLTLQPGVAKPNTMSISFGENLTTQQLDDFSPDKHVTAHTPPYFIFATTTDQSVPPLSSTAFYAALVRAGVPAEIHIFEQGPHGTALSQGYPALSAWPGLLENWLRLNGWIPAPSAGPVH